MTTTEAAAIAGRTATTIRNWIAKGRLQAGTARMSGPPWVRWDITEEALDAAIADQRKPGRPYKHPQAQTPQAQTPEAHNEGAAIVDGVNRKLDAAGGYR